MPEEGRDKGCGECADAGLVHVDYPHEAGYLWDCAACEDHCHCGRGEGKPIPGAAACVFNECHDDDEGPDEEGRRD